MSSIIHNRLWCSYYLCIFIAISHRTIVYGWMISMKKIDTLTNNKPSIIASKYVNNFYQVNPMNPFNEVRPIKLDKHITVTLTPIIIDAINLPTTHIYSLHVLIPWTELQHQQQLILEHSSIYNSNRKKRRKKSSVQLYSPTDRLYKPVKPPSAIHWPKPNQTEPNADPNQTQTE